MEPPLRYRNETWHYCRFDETERRTLGETTTSSSRRIRRRSFHAPVDASRHRCHEIDVVVKAVDAACSEEWNQDEVVPRNGGVGMGTEEPWKPVNSMTTTTMVYRSILCEGFLLQWMLHMCHGVHHFVLEPSLQKLTSPRWATASLLLHLLLWCLFLWRLLF